MNFIQFELLIGMKKGIYLPAYIILTARYICNSQISTSLVQRKKRQTPRWLSWTPGWIRSSLYPWYQLTSHEGLKKEKEGCLVNCNGFKVLNLWIKQSCCSCFDGCGWLDESYLVGTDDEDDAVHVGLRAHLLLHLAQPAVEGVKALAQAHIVHQQYPLAVFVELVANLTERAWQSPAAAPPTGWMTTLHPAETKTGGLTS